MSGHTNAATEEYAAALAAYRQAVERLREAKRHLPPTPRQVRRAEREAFEASAREFWRANPDAGLAQLVRHFRSQWAPSE